MKNQLLILAYLLLAVVTSASPAYAYLDPGTGSMILQGLLGGLAAGAAVIGIYWQKVKAFFGRTRARSAVQESEGTSRNRKV